MLVVGNFAQSTACVLLGLVGIYRGLWNLKFGAQDWRGVLLTLLGIAALFYGSLGILTWSVS